MYYIMSTEGQHIETWDHFTMDELKKLAEDCQCDLYVIEGEHSGITYTRPTPDEDELLQEAQAQRDEDNRAYQAMVLQGLGRP